MKNMKNILLVPFVAVLLLMVVGFASATPFAITGVEVDGADVTGGIVSGFAAGSVVPVRVWFTSSSDQSDVEIEVEFQGYDETDTVSQDFGYVENNTEYRSKIFNMKIPNDVDDASEETSLYVTISSKERGSAFTDNFDLKLQRESYELDVLAVDYASKVSAGDVFPVSVVVENNGYGFAEDNFVIVSIPALSISVRGYIGDLDSSEDYDHDNHEEDAVQKMVYLTIPSDAESGVYEMEIAVYNDDSKTITGKLIAVDGVEPADDTEVLESNDSETSASVIALTVILVIIFVVLLAVLVVLLTRKERPVEEVETSYY